jgi:hypothetical protein
LLTPDPIFPKWTAYASIHIAGQPTIRAFRNGEIARKASLILPTDR